MLELMIQATGLAWSGYALFNVNGGDAIARCISRFMLMLGVRGLQANEMERLYIAHPTF